MLSFENGAVSRPTYSLISQEMIRQMRGDLSQNELSKKIGYSFNQVGKWESGATAVSWIDFVKVCEALNIPWQKHFEDTFVWIKVDKFDSATIIGVLSQFFGFSSISEMAEKIAHSRSVVSRWMSGNGIPDLSEILQIIDYKSFILSTWLSKFVDPSSLPSFRENFLVDQNVLRGVLALPQSSVVNAALHLQPYKDLPSHSDEWISRQTGLDVFSVRKSIELLLSLKLIDKKEKHYQSYFGDFTFMRVPEFRRVTQYLNERVSKSFSLSTPQFPNREKPSMCASRIFPVSSLTSQKLTEAFVRFHHEIGEIIKEDQGPRDHVRCVLMYSLDASLLRDVSDSDNDRSKVEM